MNAQLVHFIENNIIESFHAIPEKRKEILIKLTDFLKKKLTENKTVQIIFVCTHNSRRSHMSQLWAQAAASYYKIPHVHCFSGGTEETAFNPRSVKALQKAGFEIARISQSENPVYEIKIDDKEEPIRAFSKKFSHESNPQSEFCAVMTCTDADEACPFVPGAEARISLPYEDPKKSDDTALESETYEARSIEIAREIFYAFSRLSDK
jgi:arsenate reductase (thioredoxin)